MHLQIIILLEIRNRFADSTSIVVSERTIQRELHQSGYFGRMGTRKPYVNGRNKKIRLNWAKEKKNWKRNGIGLYGVTNHISVYLMGMGEDGCGDNQKRNLM